MFGTEAIEGYVGFDDGIAHDSYVQRLVGFVNLIHLLRQYNNCVRRDLPILT